MVMLFHIIFSISSAFILATLPSNIIKILEKNTDIHTILVPSIFLLTGLCLLQVGERLFGYYYNCQTFIFRYKQIPNVGEAILNLDYETIDSKDGKVKIDQAYEALFNGGNAGLEFFLNEFERFILNIFGFFLYMVITFDLNVWLTIFIFLINIVSIYIKHNNVKWLRKNKKQRDENHTKYNYLVRQVITQQNGKDIRLYHIQDWFTKLFNEINNRSYIWYKQLQRKYFVSDSVERLTFLLRDSIVLGYLFHLSTQQQITISEFLFYLGVIGGLNTWLKQIFDSYNNLSKNNMYITDLRKFSKLPSDYSKNSTQKEISINSLIQDIQFEGVTYKHPDASESILKQVSFHIKPGEKIALVGANGAGKTTIIKVLCGLYRPTEGKILLNGTDSFNYNKKENYSFFSVAFQDNSIFAFSIAKNVACKPESKINYEQVEKCLKLAGLWDKVKELPQGMNTPLTRELDDQGILLSGGEMQKLMLARMLYNKADVYILDEPTAALDSITEANLYKLYSDFSNKKTSIFVSHRLSSTIFCDRILLVKDGKIIEEGTHKELIALGGEYAHMYEIQSYYYKNGGNER
jgi:ABC-type multidrug transport system fused ATPase/permease subunit